VERLAEEDCRQPGVPGLFSSCIIRTRQVKTSTAMKPAMTAYQAKQGRAGCKDTSDQR